MSLTTEAGLQILAEEAAPLAREERLARRVADVRAVWGEELDYVERELARSAQAGESPGREAALHLLSGGGKRVRPLALLLACRSFGPIPKAAKEVAVAVELIHSATLLHDDVLDSGTERRGSLAARLVWGNAVSILSGDLLLVDALERTHASAPELMPRLLGTLRSLVNGEIVQLRGRVQLDLREATYFQILRDKTASLFCFASQAGARLGGASATAEHSMSRFGSCLGTAFQLIDDALDYESQGTGKTLLADLREGKLTLPLVLAGSMDPTLMSLIQRIHHGETADVERVRKRVLELGVCEVVRRRAREFTHEGVRALEEVPFSSSRALLASVAEQLIERSR